MPSTVTVTVSFVRASWANSASLELAISYQLSAIGSELSVPRTDS
jgi:hypothetical protein